jgi:hypothetical protein
MLLLLHLAHKMLHLLVKLSFELLRSPAPLFNFAYFVLRILQRVLQLLQLVVCFIIGPLQLTARMIGLRNFCFQPLQISPSTRLSHPSR